MSRCKNCNVEILDETDRCPLCNSVLEPTVEVENMYPNVRPMTRRMTLVSHIYLFCAILAEAILVYVNLEYSAQTYWSVIPGLTFLYIYMVLRYAILGKAGYKGKVIVLTALAVLMIIAIDFVEGYQGWSVAYVLPAGILFLDAAILLLMFINRRNWQSYIMWQILMILISLIPLFLDAGGVIHSVNLSLVALAVSVFLFLGTVIIGDRRARVELKRRFHIR